jgi:5,5'-dehydrodivanillate O-demethylase
VPIDDTHTQIFWAGFLPGKPLGDTLDHPPVQYLEGLTDETGEYTLTTFSSQDKMAWETEGPLFDRSQEHLGASDRGITMWRKLTLEQIEKVERGEDPIALVRDPAANGIIEFEVSKGKSYEGYVKLRQDEWGRYYDEDKSGQSAEVKPAAQRS